MPAGDPAAIAAAAELLAANRLNGHRFEAFPDALRPAFEDVAYEVQARLHERLTADRATSIAGAKIGCTTPVMQAYLGIRNPAAGGILAHDVHHRHGRRPAPRTTRLGVECEIAVRLGRDLGDGPFTPGALRGAVAAVMPAIEIVEDRYLDYRRLDTPTLIADDFFNAGCVLGPERSDWQALELAAVAGVMRINGRQVGRGQGADVLGDPLAALAWLADLRRAQGRPLRARTFVLLGSVVQTVWLDPGDRVEVDLDGLGSASLELV